MSSFRAHLFQFLQGHSCIIFRLQFSFFVVTPKFNPWTKVRSRTLEKISSFITAYARESIFSLLWDASQRLAFSETLCSGHGQGSAQILSDIFFYPFWAPFSQLRHAFASNNSHIRLSVGGFFLSKRVCLILQPCLTSFSLAVLLPLPISPGRASVINHLLRVCFWESHSKSPCKNNHTLKSIFKRWQLLYSCCSFQINSSPSSNSSNRGRKKKKKTWWLGSRGVDLCLWNLITVPLV